MLPSPVPKNFSGYVSNHYQNVKILSVETYPNTYAPGVITWCRIHVPGNAFGNAKMLRITGYIHIGFLPVLNNVGDSFKEKVAVGGGADVVWGPTRGPNPINSFIDMPFNRVFVRYNNRMLLYDNEFTQVNGMLANVDSIVRAKNPDDISAPPDYVNGFDIELKVELVSAVTTINIDPNFIQAWIQSPLDLKRLNS